MQQPPRAMRESQVRARVRGDATQMRRGGTWLKLRPELIPSSGAGDGRKQAEAGERPQVPTLEPCGITSWQAKRAVEAQSRGEPTNGVSGVGPQQALRRATLDSQPPPPPFHEKLG